MGAFFNFLLGRKARYAFFSPYRKNFMYLHRMWNGNTGSVNDLGKAVQDRHTERG